MEDIPAVPNENSLKKSYNMVSSEILEEALKGYGFPREFTQKIMTCVASPMFTVKVNGEGSGYFRG